MKIIFKKFLYIFILLFMLFLFGEKIITQASTQHSEYAERKDEEEIFNDIKSNNGSGIWLLITGGVLILISLGGLIFVFKFFNKKSKKKKDIKDIYSN
jgi:Na+/proline symporter